MTVMHRPLDYEGAGAYEPLSAQRLLQRLHGVLRDFGKVCERAVFDLAVLAVAFAQKRGWFGAAVGDLGEIGIPAGELIEFSPKSARRTYAHDYAGRSDPGKAI